MTGDETQPQRKPALFYVLMGILVVGVVQLVLAAVCLYATVGIDDNVWRGIRLDKLAGTALGIGLLCTLIGGVGATFPGFHDGS